MNTEYIQYIFCWHAVYHQTALRWKYWIQCVTFSIEHDNSLIQEIFGELSVAISIQTIYHWETPYIQIEFPAFSKKKNWFRLWIIQSISHFGSTFVDTKHLSVAEEKKERKSFIQICIIWVLNGLKYESHLWKWRTQVYNFQPRLFFVILSRCICCHAHTIPNSI